MNASGQVELLHRGSKVMHSTQKMHDIDTSRYNHSFLRGNIIDYFNFLLYAFPCILL